MQWPFCSQTAKILTIMDRFTVLNERPENSYSCEEPFDSEGEHWSSNDYTASHTSTYHKRYVLAASALTWRNSAPYDQEEDTVRRQVLDEQTVPPYECFWYPTVTNLDRGWLPSRVRRHWLRYHTEPDMDRYPRWPPRLQLFLLLSLLDARSPALRRFLPHDHNRYILPGNPRHPSPSFNPKYLLSSHRLPSKTFPGQVSTPIYHDNTSNPRCHFRITNRRSPHDFRLSNNLDRCNTW